MESMLIGDFFLFAETIKTDKPIYLISLYGADARKVGYEIRKYGINSYYLDGGSYRLAKEMRQKKWKIFPAKRPN